MLLSTTGAANTAGTVGAALIPLTRAGGWGELSVRGPGRLTRVVWMLADLDGRRTPDEGDVHEALALRRGGPRR